MNFLLIFIVVAIVFLLLARLQLIGKSLSFNVFLGLVLGVILGSVLKYAQNIEQIKLISTYLNIIEKGYAGLLQMVVIPLILFPIINSIIKLRESSSLRKISFFVIIILILTTAVSALIGVVISNISDLDMSGIIEGTNKIASNTVFEQRKTGLLDMGLPAMITELFPKNIFSDLAGTRSTSTVAVMIFAFFVGIACLRVYKIDETIGSQIEKSVLAINKILTQLVKIALLLTPYGIFAIMARTIAQTDVNPIVKLANFLASSYIGFFIILLFHLLIIQASGKNSISYLKSVAPVLSLAFRTRSSSGTIPLNIDCQINKLGNNSRVASFSASFGAMMGQNGCAGLFPAMLAVMVAPTVGIDPTNTLFLTQVIFITAISSFGISGIGGGASIASLVVLSTLDLPTAIVGLLISIEPIIDMGRTAINVSGSMTAGTITSRIIERNNHGNKFHDETNS